MNKVVLAVLKILERQKGLLGSRELAKQLVLYGFDLKERSVRYHLKFMDEQGFTKAYGKLGRKITEKGRMELRNAFVSDRVGFVISKVETLSYLTSLDLNTLSGRVILNISFFPEEKTEKLLRIIRPVFSSPYVMNDRIILARGGEMIEDILVPQGKIALGTLCSVTMNGIFLKAGIPISSRFGGVLEIVDHNLRRFTALIGYEASSLDPHEIFIKSKMAGVLGAVKNGTGGILASFREIPAVCVENAKRLLMRMEERGIKGILAVGDPNKPLLDIPASLDKAGVIVAGGLNPVAVLEQFGISTENEAMATLYEYSRLRPFAEVYGEVMEKRKNTPKVFGLGKVESGFLRSAHRI